MYDGRDLVVDDIDTGFMLVKENGDDGEILECTRMADDDKS